MHSSICIPTLSKLNLNHNPFLGEYCFSSRPPLPLTLRRRASLSTRALLSPTKHAVLKDFQERRALKVILTHFPFLFISLFSVFFSLFFYVLFFLGNFKTVFFFFFFFVQSNRGINPTLNFALLFILVLIFPLNFFSLTWGIEGAKIAMLFLEIMFF